MKLIDEFKAFVMRGNVIDLAFAVIIGGAFGKIVSSLVEDIIMPPVGMLLGGVDFTDLVFIIQPAGGEGSTVAEVAIRYGLFLQYAIDFLIVAGVLFFALKAINSMHRKKEEAPGAQVKSAELLVLEDIRDSLKKKV